VLVGPSATVKISAQALNGSSLCTRVSGGTARCAALRGCAGSMVKTSPNDDEHMCSARVAARARWHKDLSASLLRARPAPIALGIALEPLRVLHVWDTSGCS
jgi:hypothetical protein